MVETEAVVETEAEGASCDAGVWKFGSFVSIVSGILSKSILISLKSKCFISCDGSGSGAGSGSGSSSGYCSCSLPK